MRTSDVYNLIHEPHTSWGVRNQGQVTGPIFLFFDIWGLFRQNISMLKCSKALGHSLFWPLSSENSNFRQYMIGEHILSRGSCNFVLETAHKRHQNFDFLNIYLNEKWEYELSYKKSVIKTMVRKFLSFEQFLIFLSKNYNPEYSHMGI